MPSEKTTLIPLPVNPDWDFEQCNYLPIEPEVWRSGAVQTKDDLLGLIEALPEEYSEYKTQMAQSIGAVSVFGVYGPAGDAFWVQLRKVETTNE